jgi:subtilisin family serine protease
LTSLIPLYNRLLISAGFILLSVGFSYFYADAAPNYSSAVVKQGVEQAFADQDRVAVLIKLKDPSISSPGRLPVKTSSNRLQSNFKAAFSRETIAGEMKINRKMGRIPWISARISRGVLETLRHHDQVAVIEEDVPIYASLAESAPLIHGDRAYHNGYTGMGINVAVVDTGIDTDHPDLVDSVVWEECFLSEDPCPLTGTDRASGPGSGEDNNGHGSHVSGIITSDNETYRGIAPAAGIVAIKILDGGGNGNLSDLVAALDWVADNHDTHGIRIVNMSLGSFVYAGICDNENPSLAEAADAVKAAGVVLVAASGNDGSDGGLDSPACLSSVISVGAVYDAGVDERSYYQVCTDWTTAPDQIACFSNVSTVLDLLAPGARIASTYLNGGTTVKAGTSMACPHAAGMAALLLEANPDQGPDDLLSLMAGTGMPVYDARIDISFPRINATAALGIDSPDLDGDGDVDGRDLGLLPADSAGFILEAFAAIFGRVGGG